ALMLGDNESNAGASFGSLLCKVEYAEPTAFTADIWSISDLRAASDRLHRAIALLEGSIITLAVFLAAISLRTREGAYLLASAWLIGNLRLCSYALGWDSQWLGYAVPVDWQPAVRQLTLALYYLLSYWLFLYLWRGRDAQPQRLSAALLWLGIVQLVGALLLPWAIFQWLATAIWVAALLIGLYLVVNQSSLQPRQLLNWRAALTAITLVVLAGCLKLTIQDLDTVVDSFAVVLGLVLVNILVVLAVLGMIRDRRKQRIHAQTELVTSYAVAPLGLFTLDNRG